MLAHAFHLSTPEAKVGEFSGQPELHDEIPSHGKKKKAIVKDGSRSFKTLERLVRTEHRLLLKPFFPPPLGQGFSV